LEILWLIGDTPTRSVEESTREQIPSYSPRLKKASTLWLTNLRLEEDKWLTWIKTGRARKA
jgi:hypothetical protein